MPGTPRHHRSFVPASLLGATLALSACGGPPPPPVTVTSLPPAVVATSTQTLTPEQIAAVTALPGDAAYIIGAGDVISVSVYLHPELNVPSASLNSALGGALVTGDGTVELPLIGAVNIGGLTLRQASAALTDDYAAYIKNPRVAVQIAQAQSLRYYLLGAFTAPGVKYPTQQLTLLNALALGGSVDIAHADLFQAYVAHGSVKLPVDLHALLVDGDLSQNITLASGDTIVVPSAASENAFVFGTVAKPGAVAFQSGELSVLQALASAGMDLATYTQAELSRIYIIRAEGPRAEYITVNARDILQGQAAPFALQPGDIVFVPPTGIASFDQALNLLLPSLQTIAGVLNPFVSIAYLGRLK